MKILLLILITNLFMTSLSVAKPTEDKAFNSPIPLTEQCKSFIEGLERADFYYEWVHSYEDPNDSNSNPVYVFYYMQKGPRYGTPTIFFNGGPQKESHTAPSNFISINNNTSTLYFKMIFTDQRGTGCSSPYPKYSSDNNYKYSYWTTIGIVHDAEMIRKRLGLSQWNIFGQSYGGFIVQRYIEKYPQSILKAVSHGGLSLGNASELGMLMDLRYEFQMQVIKKFLDQYPLAKAMIETIVRKRLCAPKHLKIDVCGAKLVHALGAKHQLIIKPKSGWSDLYDYLDQTVKYNITKPLHHPDPKVLNQPVAQDDDSISLFKAGRYITTFDTDNDLINFNRLRTLGLRTLGSIEMLSLTEFFEQGNRDYREKKPEFEGYLKFYQTKIQIDRVDLDVIKENLETHPNLKFFVFSAELDYLTPPIIVEKAVKEMGNNVQYTELLNKGHASFNHPCVLIHFIEMTPDLYKNTMLECIQYTKGRPFK